MPDQYQYYKEVFRGRAMPFAFVDLDRFDRNMRDIAARAAGMPIRVASKSIRCVALLRRILADTDHFWGIMCYSAREAAHLAAQGFDDLLVAYPVMSEMADPGVIAALRAGARITLMVDCPEHVACLDAAGRAAGVTVPVCLDVDMASRYPGMYFGVHRSPVRTAEQALALWREIQGCSHVRLDGVMGYEAQIASLQERVPGRPLMNRIIAFLKRRSRRETARRRAGIVAALRADGAELRFVNGGGTGSIETTREDPKVTEVTVGSGFYAPALFDHFAQFRHMPAAGYAIEIIRRPGPGVYTCQGGGYAASGAAGPDKLPRPYLPEGAALFAREAAGEVQTPIRYAGPQPIEIGDPVFLRHAKAGELCERFNTLLLVSQGRIVDEVPTYRGEGRCFL